MRLRELEEATELQEFCDWRNDLPLDLHARLAIECLPFAHLLEGRVFAGICSRTTHGSWSLRPVPFWAVRGHVLLFDGDASTDMETRRRAVDGISTEEPSQSGQGRSSTCYPYRGIEQRSRCLHSALWSA